MNAFIIYIVMYLAILGVILPALWFVGYLVVGVVNEAKHLVRCNALLKEIAVQDARLDAQLLDIESRKMAAEMQRDQDSLISYVKG